MARRRRPARGHHARAAGIHAGSLEVEGTRLVIDAFSMPYATAEELAELTEVVEAIRFER